ncbi:DUF4190 domain-containing protein [Pimelobacter simplex]|uniref:Uncharacterized protein n=1 Tax=Nocardioides simplex TaxID=2045 RepID=A0A0A1DP53_NOCSI|nr:DUF4190 domain-containing protein [Pimelobacter simplex]AIY18397.1 hypothetical protein KR76_19450 [Pimelobacter simplex]MCG8153917.1 DUF4190 domain-containing protein [Pimelobacter simplex]GEB16342.1 hypothetical protein NSI01_46570 [Pimelobacter simplex]SFM35716.1 protein of unknown function [Pimelobacter simplex]
MSDPYGSNPQSPYGGGQGNPNPYGAPQGGGYGPPSGSGYPGAPGGYDATPPKKTDGVSVASFVLSLLCCTGLIGLILGFIGLSRTKGGQRKGRGFAIAGIALGLVSVLVGVGLVVAVSTGLFGTPINDLKDGQCITGNGLDKSADEGVSGIKVVKCDEDHDAQVIATKKLSSSEAKAYDFGDQQQIVEHCSPMLDAGEASLIIDPKYFVIALTQDKKPSSGDKVVCVLTLADGGKLDKKLP